MDSARSQRPAHVINDLPIVIYQPIGTVLFCDHVMELLGLGSLHACLNTGASISRFRNFKYQDCTNRASGVGLCPSSPGSHPQGASLDLLWEGRLGDDWSYGCMANLLASAIADASTRAPQTAGISAASSAQR